jgi:Flp pilus assembly protein TadD
VLFFLPTSSLVFPAGTVMAERLSYLPSVGGCLLAGQIVAAMLAALGARRGYRGLVAGIAVVGILIPMAVRTVRRNPVWRDNDSLALHDVRVNPRSAKLQAGAGIVLHARGESARAETHYRRAIEIYPDYAQVHYNLGQLLRDRGEIEKAVEHLERASILSPNNPRPYKSLAPLLERLDQRERALAAYAAGVRLDPLDQSLRFNYGRCLLVAGRAREARKVLVDLSLGDRGGLVGRLAAGLVAELDGDPASARRIYTRLLADPGLSPDVRRRVRQRLSGLAALGEH